MNNDPFLFVIVSWMRDQSMIVIQLDRTMVVWMVTSWYYHELDGTFFHSGVCSGKPDESRPSWPAWRCLQWSLSVSIYRVDLFHRQTSVNQTIEYEYTPSNDGRASRLYRLRWLKLPSERDERGGRHSDTYSRDGGKDGRLRSSPCGGWSGATPGQAGFGERWSKNGRRVHKREL